MRRAVRAIVAGTIATAALAVAAPAGATPPIPDLGKQYWFGNYRISEVWATGAQGQGITVAVLDSGVQADRPELRGVVLPGTDLAGGDGRTDSDAPRGHGTAMATLIAGQGGGPNNLTGIAPAARILPVNVDLDTSPQTLADGIGWAVAHGATVLNISEAGDGGGNPGSCPPEVASAVRSAVAKGAVVIAGAGNSAQEGNPVMYPASCPGVVAVGAIDGAKRPWPKSERQPYVDVAAPGVQMFSQNLAGQQGVSNGTSDATALVSGATALVWSKFPSLTNRQIVARLLATVTDDAATPGRDDATGYGIVRPLFAITQNIPATAPNPIFDELDAEPASSSPPVQRPSSAPAGSSSAAAGPSSQPSSSGTSLGPLLAVGGAVVLVIVGAAVAMTRRRPTA